MINPIQFDPKPVIEIEVGYPGRDYRGGDFLNALDSLVCWYEHETGLSSDHIADLMETYADGMKE